MAEEVAMAHIQRRTATDGSVSWRVRIRLRGSRIQTATFKRLTDARRWAQQTEAAIREGRHFRSAEARRHTVAELIDRYIETVLPEKSPSTVSNQTRQLQHWRERTGSVLLADVTPALIAQVRDDIRTDPEARFGKRSASTINRYLNVLSHAFSVAVREWGWIETNPVKKVRRQREPRGRVRFLDDDERKRLLDACRASSDPYLYPVVVLGLATGCRKMELLRLRWPDVDFGRGFVVLHDTKTKERRGVPLRGLALEIVADLGKIRRLDTDLMFPHSRDPQRPADIRRAWENALKEAKIEDFRFHDLRHTTASMLAMDGATLTEIAEVLGHKTLQMVKRYSHLTEHHTGEVLDRMTQRMFNM